MSHEQTKDDILTPSLESRVCKRAEYLLARRSMQNSRSFDMTISEKRPFDTTKGVEGVYIKGIFC